MSVEREPVETFFALAITRYHNEKAQRDKEDQQKARIEQSDKDEETLRALSLYLAQVFSNGMTPGRFLVQLGNGRAQFGTVVLTLVENYQHLGNDRPKMAAVYTCKSCGDEHNHPILTQFDLGEFLVLQEEGSLLCRKVAKKETAEEKFVAALREFMKQGG